jgi:phage tail tube protein FII
MNGRRAFAVFVAALVAISALTLGGTVPVEANHECDISDSLTFSIARSFTDPNPGGNDGECQVFHGRETVNTTQTDANQTKIDIYESAQTVSSQTEVYSTSLDNYLEDTEANALMAGKNAYIRALNNGSSKSAAKTSAKQAVADYYAVKQKNLAKAWENQLAHGSYMRSQANNETNVAAWYPANTTYNTSFTDNYYWGPDSYLRISNYSKGTRTLTLTNSSNIDVATFETDGYNAASGRNCYAEWSIDDVGTNRTVICTVDDQPRDFNVTGARVEAPTSDFSPIQYQNMLDYRKKWEKIDSQKNSVQSELDTFINNTYDKYQAGDIDNSDLVDPYLGASRYSPSGDYQAWALSSLLSMGYSAPSNLSDFGSMAIEEGGQRHEGILMSDGEPPAGQFVAGSTYDAANIDGSQIILTNDSKREITGEFTVLSATDADGNEQEAVSYTKPDYSTANTSEYRKLSNELANLRAQVEAREQALRNSSAAGGGGIFAGGFVPPGLSNFGPVGPFSEGLPSAGAAAGGGLVGGAVLLGAARRIAFGA